MIISVASGKGGTGKTLVATSLALSLKDRHSVQLLDCDVEEPNDHIFLKPAITRSEAVYIQVPKVDEGKCTYCGKCAEVCAYHAIAVLGEHVLTFPQLCHGCGATIAAGSMVTELVRGKSVSQALRIGQEGVLNALSGLPEESQHCALLAANTLKEAVKDYFALKKEPWKRNYKRY